MKVVLDTNILFSALLQHRSAFAEEIFLNGLVQLRLFRQSDLCSQ